MIADPSANPFVGLRPFESHESLLFFGRQEQTLQLLQRLHQHHFVAVIGNSGSGKSSLVKAGLIPRLQAGYLVNDSDKWMITDMRPGQTPLCNLSSALLRNIDRAADSLSATSLERMIKDQGIDVILDLLLPSWENNTNFFLLVDQFEELFRFSMGHGEVEKRDEAVYFVNTLLELSTQTLIPVYVVFTMRSDFIGDCAKFYGLPEAMNNSQYIVPRLNRMQLKNTIEGPVKLYNERIHPSLTARLLNDVQIVNDELPLLQHTLMRIWDKEINTDNRNELDIAGYESIGGIEKALSNHADEALMHLKPAELQVARKTFQALTAIDDNGRKIRRPARLSELSRITGTQADELTRLLNLFIQDNRSFLFISQVEEKNDMLVDISHESLIRQWSTLNEWVDEEAASADMFIRLTESARLQSEGKKDLLTGNELHQQLEWYHSFHPTAAWAARYSNAYNNSIRYLLQSEQEWKAAIKEKENHRARKLRNLRLLFIAAIAAGLAIGLLAWLTYQKGIDIHNQLARNYWNNSQSARDKGNRLQSLLLTAEAVATSEDKTLTGNLLTDVQPFLPMAFLTQVFPHTGKVYKVLFTKDGKRVLTAGYDGAARLWDISSGRQLGATMQHRGGGITGIAWSKDEKLIATAGDDSTARIWNTASGKQIGVSLQHGAAVRCVVFSPDGKFILTAGSDSAVRLWNLSTLKQTGPSMMHAGEVYSAVFSHDSKKILTAGSDSTARIWNTGTCSQEGRSLRHRGVVNSAVFSPDENMILTASDDSTARLWNASTMQQQGPSMKHNGMVTCAEFDPDGTRILTAGTDSTARLWNTSSGSQLGQPMVMDNTVNSAVFSADGKTILTASYDFTARLWDAGTQKQLGAPLIHEGIVYNAVFGPGGNSMLTAGADGTARFWVIARPKKYNTVFHFNDVLFTAVLSPDGTKLLTAGFDHTARIVDVKTGKQAGASLKQDSVVAGAVFSPDGKMIVTAGYDSTARIWDAVTHRQIVCIRHKAEVKHAVFSPDGNRVLTTSGSQAREWAVQTGLLTSIYFQDDIPLTGAVYSADGKRVLTANSRGIACLFDAGTTGVIRTYGKKGDAIKSAVFSFDGNKILTAGEDDFVRQWDVETGTQAGTAIKHSSVVNGAVFDHGGSMILTACEDGAARLWDTVSGYQIGVAMRHNKAVKSAAFSSDGRRVITTGYDSTVRIWEVEDDRDMPADLFKLQAQVMTGVELNSNTNEILFLPPDDWHERKYRYEKRAIEHARNCLYPEFNLWKRFHQQDYLKKIGYTSHHDVIR